MPDKTNKLTANNSVLKDRVGMCVPVESSFGRIITNYFTKLSPCQMRIYCRPGTEAQKAHFKNMGHPNALFSPNQPLGEHLVQKLIKSGLKKMGFLGVTGHALRRLFITTLANDPHVSIEESMLASHHSSVAAQRPFVLADGVFEAARFRALGLKK